MSRNTFLRIAVLLAAGFSVCWHAANRGFAQDKPTSEDRASDSTQSLQEAIEFLASPTAAERQQAFQKLVQGRERSIPLLQQAATNADIDVAEICVGALYQIGKGSTSNNDTAIDRETEQQVLQALNAVANDENARGTLAAKKAYRGLTITDIDRAIEALTRSGVQIRQSQSQKIYSLQLSADSQLKWARSFPDLRYISLLGPGVSDNSLAYLKNIDTLQAINVANTQISDDGIKEFVTIPNLTSVSLTGEQFSDVAIGYLSKLPKLNRISWGGKTDEFCLQALAEIPNLRSLSLSKVTWNDRLPDILNSIQTIDSLRLSLTNLTDPQCQILSQVKADLNLSIGQAGEITSVGWTQIGKLSLTRLSLMGTSIDDVSIGLLGDQPKLTSISFIGGNVTDQGLVHLYPMQALRYAYFHSTEITEEGVNKLRRAIPGLRRVSGIAKNPPKQPAAPQQPAAPKQPPATKPPATKPPAAPTPDAKQPAAL